MITNKLRTYLFRYRLKRKFPKCDIVFARPVRMERLRLGLYSYGIIDFITFNPTGVNILEIGDFVSIASIKILMDENHDTESLSPFPFLSLLKGSPDCRDCQSKGDVIIGDHAWIGEDVIILSGLNIGIGAIVAAGSVVTKDVPAGCIAAEVPAKVIRNRLSTSEIKELESTNYLKALKQKDIKILKK